MFEGWTHHKVELCYWLTMRRSGNGVVSFGSFVATGLHTKWETSMSCHWNSTLTSVSLGWQPLGSTRQVAALYTVHQISYCNYQYGMPCAATHSAYQFPTVNSLPRLHTPNWSVFKLLFALSSYCTLLLGMHTCISATVYCYLSFHRFGATNETCMLCLTACLH